MLPAFAVGLKVEGDWTNSSVTAIPFSFPQPAEVWIGKGSA